MSAVLLVAIAVYGQLTGPNPPSATKATGVDLRCGEYCLLLSLRALEIAEPTLEQLEGKLGQPSAVGYSMKQLAEAGESFGAFTVGVKTSLDNLERRSDRFACIALLEDTGHFVCIIDVDDKNVYVVDPPEQRTVDREAFAKLWSGTALLVAGSKIGPATPSRFSPWSWAPLVLAVAAGVAVIALTRPKRHARGPIHSAGVLLLIVPLAGIACSRNSSTVPTVRDRAAGLPHAEVEPGVVDLGRIEVIQGASKEGLFRLNNQGTATLKILSTSASCGCTIVTWPTLEVAPGAAAVVKVRVNARNETGSHTSVVSVQTNDPANPLITIPVEWSEQSAITIDPKVLDFGFIEAGKAILRTVDVQLAPQLATEQLDTKCYDQNVAYSWEGDEPIQNAGKLAVRRLKVRLAPVSEVATGSAELRIVTRDSRYAANLAINWRAGPQIGISPRALFHSGVSAGAKVESRLLITPHNSKSPSLRDVELDGRHVDYQIGRINQENATVLVLKFTVEAGQTAGLERHTIRVRIRDVGEESS